MCLCRIIRTNIRYQNKLKQSRGLRCVLRLKLPAPLTAYPNLIPVRMLFLKTCAPKTPLRTSWTQRHCITTHLWLITSLPQHFSKQQGITWRSAVKLRGHQRQTTSRAGVPNYVLSRSSAGHPPQGSAADDSLPDVRTEESILMKCFLLHKKRSCGLF